MLLHHLHLGLDLGLHQLHLGLIVVPEQEEGVVGQQTACSQQGTQSVERVGHQGVVEGGRGEGGGPMVR